jgi:hypothetical protein
MPLSLQSFRLEIEISRIRVRSIPVRKPNVALYDLARAERFVPFLIFFAGGQRYEIKTREHIGIGPVSRSDFEKLKAVVVWDDRGEFRSLYLPAVLKVEELRP